MRAAVSRMAVRRTRLWIAVAVVAVLALAAAAWFTPVLAARTVEIDGAAAVSEDSVRELLEIPDGRSMLRLDTEAMARRVAALPKVRSVRVQRLFPSTVKVTVQERVPALYFDSPQGAHLVDAQGVEYAIEAPPIGVPKLITAHPAGADPVTEAAVTVVAALPPALTIQVNEVAARSISDIALNLKDGRTVLWGGANEVARKAAVVVVLLTREGTVFDVSSPNLVTVK
ncbi:cell division protein FtsQ/DivIB [Nocardia panacis]